jgi:sugar/nucleoside kinase (ribokinase family)
VWAFSQDQSWRYAPVAQRGLHIVDTIGAGDCFDAGFVRAWQLGKPMDECLAWGARGAEASLSAAGGIDGQLQGRII